MLKTKIQRYFALDDNHSSIKQECLAGLTTYFTMAYIVLLNPQILHQAGMNLAAVFVATCLVTAFASILVGLFANYPIAVAPGVPLLVYFSYTVVQNLAIPWQSALACVFIAGIIFFILAISKIRVKILHSIPKNLQIGICVGIGMFILLLGLNSGKIIVSNPHTLVTLGDLHASNVLLSLLGFGIIVILNYYRVTAGILISIIITSILGMLLGISSFHGLVALPPSLSPTLLKLNIHALIQHETITIIFTFLLIALFDSTGTLIGLLQQGSFQKDVHYVSRFSKTLTIESLASCCGALLGTSATSPYTESAAGIQSGGRTGLTAVTVGILFLLTLFFSPLAASIPSYAVAPALIYVGILMIKNIQFLEFEDFSEYIPSVITMIMIPLSFSIADGLGLGIISYVLMKLACSQFRNINGMLLIITSLFILHFIYNFN